jgi:SAM-dependent methyltransferase
MGGATTRAEELAVADAIGERVTRYILDGSDGDLRRLLGIAQVLEAMAGRAFQRVGIEKGWSAIECGCGPIGGLAVLAELVGPSGRVMGVDFGEATVERARSIVATLELENVQVIAADVHDVDVDELGGPFDLAYTRCFLMHQSDPTHTLARIAQLVRPGGCIVAQEPLRHPPPRSHPHLEALSTYWELLHQLTARVGVPDFAVADLPQAARAAGLEVLEIDGFFKLIEPDQGFGLHAGTLAAMRDRAVRLGVASEEEVDRTLATLSAAKSEAFEWVSSPFYLDLALRKPSAPSAKR